jgi:hypothetical protein
VDSRILRRSFSTPVVATILLGGFAVKCVAPETPREPGAQERRLLAQSYLDQRLTRWQERLKLQDWTITLVMSHPGDLRRGTLGNVHWDADKKTAMIRVLDAADYGRPFRSTLQDMEFTVVHELVHLELTSLTRNFKSRSEESFSEEEQAVNRMSDALLQLDQADQSARLDDIAGSLAHPRNR